MRRLFVYDCMSIIFFLLLILRAHEFLAKILFLMLENEAKLMCKRWSWPMDQWMQILGKRIAMYFVCVFANRALFFAFSVATIQLAMAFSTQRTFPWRWLQWRYPNPWARSLSSA